MNVKGRIYALPVVLEADSREDAFDRISAVVGPEPGNAQVVGEPFEIGRAEEYDSRSVAAAILAGAGRELAGHEHTEPALRRATGSVTISIEGSHETLPVALAARRLFVTYGADALHHEVKGKQADLCDFWRHLEGEVIATIEPESLRDRAIALISEDRVPGEELFAFVLAFEGER